MNNNDIIQENTTISFKISENYVGQRIDIVLAELVPAFSRTLLKKLLMNKQVIINDAAPAKPSYILKSNDTVTLLSIPTPAERVSKKIYNNHGIKIIAQHDDFLIINKPVGLIVHPPAGTYADIALTDWLVQEFPEIASVGEKERPGIVHRLDRNTSGIMIIALNNQAHEALSAMFKNREIQKTYVALVMGHPEQEGAIEYVIARHPVQKNMMHCFPGVSENSNARDALTNYTVLQYFDTYSLVQVKPKTGRTHQIRVHFKAIGHPLLGDTVYGAGFKRFGYHALHAQSLEFTYKNIAYNFSCPIEPKLEQLIAKSKPLKSSRL